MQQSTFLTSDSLYDDVKIDRDDGREDIDALAKMINLKLIGEAEFRPSGGELQRINFLRDTLVTQIYLSWTSQQVL